MPTLVIVNPNRLRPNPWNTNYVSPQNEDKLSVSLNELGQFKPVIARWLPDAVSGTDYEILGGEHRWQQLKAESVAEIMVLDLGEIEDIKAKKISLADNARYGTDDAGELAKLLAEIGTPEDIQRFLPYNDTDVTAIFASSDIALDELELPDLEKSEDTPEPKLPKAPKTHTIVRFKVPLSDAERLTELIVKTQKHQNFTTGDELTNAGDALVHLLLSEPA